MQQLLLSILTTTRSLRLSLNNLSSNLNRPRGLLPENIGGSSCQMSQAAGLISLDSDSTRTLTVPEESQLSKTLRTNLASNQI